MMAAAENPEEQIPEEEQETDVSQTEDLFAPEDQDVEPAEDASQTELSQGDDTEIESQEEEAGENAPDPEVEEDDSAQEEAMEAGDLEPQAEIAEDKPEEDDDGRAWFVIHCYSGYEKKVRHNLEQRIESMGMKDRIFDVIIPTQEEIEVRDGKRRSIERHVFPGYVLVNMIMSEESWYVVRNTPGVTGFVGMGNDPIPLRPEEVSEILRQMEADAPTIMVTYRPGERVRIVDGPFNDFHGVVDEIDMDRSKVRVMVNFFGRSTPVELDFLQVEKI